MINASHYPIAFAPITTHWCVQHQMDSDIPQERYEGGATGNATAFNGFNPVVRVAPTHAA